MSLLSRLLLGASLDELVLTPGVDQVINSPADTFAPTTSLHFFTVVRENMVMTSTPTIPTEGVPTGKLLWLQNRPESEFQVMLTSGDEYGLFITNSPRALGPGDNILLMFDGTRWISLTDA